MRRRATLRLLSVVCISMLLTGCGKETAMPVNDYSAFTDATPITETQPIAAPSGSADAISESNLPRINASENEFELDIELSWTSENDKGFITFTSFTSWKAKEITQEYVHPADSAYIIPLDWPADSKVFPFVYEVTNQTNGWENTITTTMLSPKWDNNSKEDSLYLIFDDTGILEVASTGTQYYKDTLRPGETRRYIGFLVVQKDIPQGPKDEGYGGSFLIDRSRFSYTASGFDLTWTDEYSNKPGTYIKH